MSKNHEAWAVSTKKQLEDDLIEFTNQKAKLLEKKEKIDTQLMQDAVNSAQEANRLNDWVMSDEGFE